MQFEVKGQVYVLALLPPNGGLGLFAPTRAGLKRLPIYDDGRESLPLVIESAATDEGQERAN